MKQQFFIVQPNSDLKDALYVYVYVLDCILVLSGLSCNMAKSLYDSELNYVPGFPHQVCKQSICNCTVAFDILFSLCS